MIKLKDILKEDEVTDKFGQVAFGSDMDLVRMQGAVSGEKNTKYETELLQVLQSWINGSDRDDVATANILHRKFPLLKKAAKVFPKLLLPKTPNGTTVYRGLDYPSQELIEKIKKTKPEDWKKEGPLMVYTKPIKYKPHKKVQSWTTDIRIAFRFSSEGPPGISGYTFILGSHQNDEFLFNQNLMHYLFSGVSGWKKVINSEEEVLHFGTTFKEEIFISMTDTQWERMFGIKK